MLATAKQYKLKCMTTILVAFLLLALAFAGLVIRKTYYYLPVKELKRRAARHDPLATGLYRAVAYGNSLRTLLWLYIGLTTAASVVVLARELPVWASLLIVGPILWIAFSIVPATRVTAMGAKITLLATPIITWLLNYLHPILSRGAEQVERRTLGPHTKLYELEDLLELIDRQQAQTDSRVTHEELEIAKRALSFSNYSVSDAMVGRKKIKIVQAEDTVGPILIDELHKNKQPYAVVRETKKGPFIGSLRVDHLGIASKGKVSDLMDSRVYYLHVKDTLSDALHAFFVTNHPIFVVIDNFEDYVGIITIEDVLKKLLGHVPGDDFDRYSDPAAVASRHQAPKNRHSDLEVDVVE